MGDVSKRATFGSVFAVGEFRALWSAELLSVAGDQLARVALSVLVYGRTHSAALTGLTYALTFVPSLAGGVFLAGLADRFPRRDIMVVIDLARMALIALAALPGTPLVVLGALVAGVSLVNAPFKAAQLALLPDVLGADRYVLGMALRTITNQSAQLAGFAGGGLLVAAVDPHIGLALDAVTFGASAVVIWLGVDRRAAPAIDSTPAVNKSPLASSATAVRFIAANRALRSLIVMSWLTGLFIVYEGLAAPYAMPLGGNAAVGVVLASDPLGAMVGAFVWGRFVPRELGARLVGVVTLLAGVPLIGCLFRPGLAVSTVLFATAGALGTAALMQSTASFVELLPHSGRAQALGLSNSGLTTVMGLSPFAAGAVADHLDTATTIGLVGVVGTLIGAGVAATWRRALAATPVGARIPGAQPAGEG